MKYTILNADESRKDYVQTIRDHLPGWEEIPNLAVDGRDYHQLVQAENRHPHRIRRNNTMGWPRVGHLGIWYSVLDALKHAPLVVFEDDAILIDDFTERFQAELDVLPDDADVFFLYRPYENQSLFRPVKHDIGLGNVVKLWQPYGGVAIYYTEQGARKLEALVRRDGLNAQVDNAICDYCWQGQLNGYGREPAAVPLVETYEGPSIAQSSSMA